MDASILRPHSALMEAVGNWTVLHTSEQLAYHDYIPLGREYVPHRPQLFFRVPLQVDVVLEYNRYFIVTVCNIT
jgi:hypothetical protein